MVDILFRNCTIIDPLNGVEKKTDLLIEEGRIKGIDSNITPKEGLKSIDLQGMWVVPALIDIHTHLREPGEEYKETIQTGLRSAAAGGFTTVCAMPNTTPPNDSSSVTRFILRRAQECGLGRVLPVAAITRAQRGEELTEFGDLLSAGAVAFSDDGLPVQNSRIMRLALEYALNFNALIISHSEDLELARHGVMNEGRMSTTLGLMGIPNAAEDIQVYRDVRLAETTGGRLHIAHISTKEAVEIIRSAKKRGVKVTCETAPHYFSLTEEAVEGFNTLAKMNPPLRTEEDRKAIIEGLKDGTIDCIATDHAPHSVLEKECEFDRAANGIIGLETAVPLGLRLVKKGHLSPMKLFELMTVGPCKVIGLEKRGILPGELADITVIDPDCPFMVTPENLQSKSHNSPFLGKTLYGRAILTLFEGRSVFDLHGMLS